MSGDRRGIWEESEEMEKELQDTQEWLMAESWWAEDFEPPGIPALCWWMLVRGSVVVVSHLFITLLGQVPADRLERFGIDIGEVIIFFEKV